MILDGSENKSTNTLSVIGEGIGRLVLLVVPHYTNPTRAYTAVIAEHRNPTMCRPRTNCCGSGGGRRRIAATALMAHQRWESEGGALRRLGHERGNGTFAADI